MIAGSSEDTGGALRKTVALVAQHDARAAAWHQACEIELQPAQRDRAGEQEMVAREQQFLAHIDEGELLAVSQHGLEGVCAQWLQFESSIPNRSFAVGGFQTRPLRRPQ